MQCNLYICLAKHFPLINIRILSAPSTLLNLHRWTSADNKAPLIDIFLKPSPLG